MTSRLPSWMLFVPLVLASFTIGSAEPPDSIGPSVTVINDASSPVPVTGVVTATLSGTPTVNVNNSPTAPLFVAPAVGFAREPFFTRVEKSNIGLQVDFTVPADKIFVIESINVTGHIDGTLERDLVSLRIRPPGEDAINAPTIQFVPIVFERAGRPTTIGGENAVRAAASLTTRLYAGPSHELLLGAPEVAALSGIASALIVISGYLAPADTPTLEP